MQLAMSEDKGEGVYYAKSGANSKDAFVHLTSSRAAYVAAARSEMLFCVASENPWL